MLRESSNFEPAAALCDAVKPTTELDRAKTPDGADITLSERDGVYAIRINGQSLMDSSATESERVLGVVGTDRAAAKPKPRILIGGLGMGFTLRSVLDHVPPNATVHVAELLQPVVDWNRTHLAELNGTALADPRVTIFVKDALSFIMRPQQTGYDVILLDIDNGPTAMVQDQNARLYAQSGLLRLHAALRPGGRAVIWSAGDDPAFTARLTRAGFRVETVRAKRYAAARKNSVWLFVADRR